MILAQWDQLRESGWIGYLAVFAIVSGPICTVLLLMERQFKLVPELNKWQEETRSRIAETLNLLQDKRATYNAKVGEFVQHLLALRAALENNERDELDGLREKCCQSLTSDVLQAHINYVEFEELYYRGDVDRLCDFIQNDVCGDIARITAWVKTLNNPKLLERIDGHRSPLIVTRSTTKPWYKLRLAVPEDRRRTVEETLWQHINSLLKVAGDYEAI